MNPTFYSTSALSLEKKPRYLFYLFINIQFINAYLLVEHTDPLRFDLKQFID